VVLVQRNIITPVDAQPPKPRITRGDAPSAPTAPPPGLPPAADDYWSRFLKYVPVEMISAYLILQGLVLSAYTSGSSARSWGLGVLLVLGAVGSYYFSRRVLGVMRPQQAAMSVLAFVIWCFAIGGWFATTDWYAGWMGTAAVVVFAVLVQILKLSPLPDPPA
jgi:branched-subunit amino acid transport protein